MKEQKPRFELGERYTRASIHAVLGGGLQDYLPNKNGRVVCACLTRKTNPEAPAIILPGSGPNIERSAEMLIRQRSPIPVFIKKATNQWVYVGEYEVAESSSSPEAIAEQARQSGRDDITMVIRMKSAKPN